jgi:hypothetical protein
MIMNDFIRRANENMSRRRFLQGGFVAFVLLLVAVLVFDFRRTVRRILKRDTSDLTVAKGAISRFLTDADEERYWRQFGLAKRALICVQDALALVGIHTPWYGKYLRYRNEITGRFLLSTDFFHEKHHEGRQISYVGFFNPYKAACGNLLVVR